ncbi:MAG: AraC family transcriptional regulator [Epulopiscium sp.]|nr:AraC family transcriptional regulator [Candidatus Epulonipiscium sp.]
MNDLILYSSEGKFMLELYNYHLKPPYDGAKGHSHHYLELSCIKSGGGLYYVEDKVYKIEKGDVFIFNNTERHGIHIDDNDELVNMVIHFEPQFIWNEGGNMFDYRYLSIFFNRDDSFENRLIRDCPSTKHIFHLMLEIEKEFNNKSPGYELMVKVKLLEILVNIIRSLEHETKTNNIYNLNNPQLAAINKLLRHIDFNIQDEIRLKDLSQIVHMNPSYLSTIFKKYNGIGPIEYISRKRIHNAVQLLKTTDKSIMEISGLCGFNNMANFNKTFKKFTGITPTESRRNK